MRKFTLTLACFIMMVTTALAWNGDVWPKTITLTAAERTLVEQNSDFAFNLFRKPTKNF